MVIASAASRDGSLSSKAFTSARASFNIPP
jgi:hypothetical protein